MTRTIDPNNTPPKDMHQYLLGAVSPRPIALISTIDEQGTPNLAPYSFYNAFSSNPPIVVFSSNRRLGDNTTKDTLYNVRKQGEVVVNAVSYDIVRQMTIASIEYPSDVSEFEKSGLTPIASEEVSPFRVKESPVQMECKVQEIIPLGDQGGAGHLIICKVLKIHVSEEVLDPDGKINPHKIDLMGRMGRAFYVRASGEAVMTIMQPVTQIGIGYQQLPISARQSNILTGNDLGRLSGIKKAPTKDDVLEIKLTDEIANLLQGENVIKNLHRRAQIELSKEDVTLAAKLVWLAEEFK